MIEAIGTLFIAIILAFLSSGVLWLWMAAIGQPENGKVDEGEIFSGVGFFLVGWSKFGLWNALKLVFTKNLRHAVKGGTIDKKVITPKAFGLCSTCCSPWLSAVVITPFFLCFDLHVLVFFGVFLTTFFYERYGAN